MSFGMERISLRKMSFKPHEWPFKVRKWAFRAFKTRSAIQTKFDLWGGGLFSLGMIVCTHQRCYTKSRLVPVLVQNRWCACVRTGRKIAYLEIIARRNPFKCGVENPLSQKLQLQLQVGDSETKLLIAAIELLLPEILQGRPGDYSYCLKIQSITLKSS